MITRRKILLGTGVLATLLAMEPAFTFAAKTAIQETPHYPRLTNEDGHTVIKVIGVGKAGCNQIDALICRDFQGIDEYIYIDTDADAISRSWRNKSTLLLGPGSGIWGRPDIARNLANAERARIADLLAGTHLVFVVAGMGWGAGTGIAPAITEVARELGVLSVAVVTTPFQFDRHEVTRAEEGIRELEKSADSLVAIPPDTFYAADTTLCDFIQGITEIIQVPGLVGVDFEDIRTVMAGTGRGLISSGTASGFNRTELATKQVMEGLSLQHPGLSGAHGLAVLIRANQTLTLGEVSEVMNTVKTAATPEATIVFGTVFDERMEDRLGITVYAS